METIPDPSPLLLTLRDRLVHLEIERDAALACLMECVNGLGKKVDWPLQIRILSDHLKAGVAAKYAPLEECLRESSSNYLAALSLLASIPVDRVADNPLWKPSNPISYGKPQQ